MKPAQAPTVFVVIGLGFGDEGKGSIVDFLARRYMSESTVIVRHNGGSQAAHNVVTDDGRHHTFSSFGSGMFLPWCQTYLSQYMCVSPGAMLVEGQHLEEINVSHVWDRVQIDEHALIVTGFHQAANRLREMFRGNCTHGSCGLGVGEAMSLKESGSVPSLFFGDTSDPKRARIKLRGIQDYYMTSLYPQLPVALRAMPEAEFLNRCTSVDIEWNALSNLAKKVRCGHAPWLHSRLRQPGTVLFEGAQGVLLDQEYGHAPYRTFSHTTAKNALVILGEAGYLGNPHILGVTRTYLTRHGAGPFPTETSDLGSVEAHNEWGRWQGSFRQGFLDLDLLKRAIRWSQPSSLAVTHMDQIPTRLCVGHKFKDAVKVWLTLQDCYCETVPTEKAYLDYIQGLGVPISILSYGPTAKAKEELYHVRP